MNRPRFQSERGTVILVALCFVAVLGISLAAYLALCSRTMQMSNRTSQTALSQQLAEMGVEEALRAFNKNDWSDWTSGTTPNITTSNWTISGTAATCNLTFPANKFGEGVTGSIKIRIDNYNASQLTSAWNSLATYRVDDVVGYNGMWYTCVQDHSTSHAPGNLAYWVPTYIPWKWNSGMAYAVYDIINYNGSWYRCITAHTSSGTTFATGTNWQLIPSVSLAWTASTAYSRGALVYNGGLWYYCTTSHTSPGSWSTTNWVSLTSPSDTWNNSALYQLGDFVYLSGAWYRAKVANLNAMPPNSTYWFNTSATSREPYISWQWRSGVAYEFNDLVYDDASGSDVWYRVKVAHTSNTTSRTTSNTTNWENALDDSWDWASTDSYNIGDVVCVSGNFYRCIRAHSNQSPPSATYWSAYPLLSNAWSSSKSYSQYTTTYYRGSWYLSLQANNQNHRPGTDNAWWAAAPRSLSAWDSSKNYSADTIVSSGGVWYRCLKDTTASQATSNTTFWVAIAGATNQWSSATSYSTGSYVNYDGVWYRSIASNSDKTPNNSTYWTALDAPVIYSEGTISIAGNAPIKTQLRATLAPEPLFPNAAGANSSTLNITGGGTVDSYDSATDANAASPGFSAVLASNYSSGTAITISSTTVNGHLAAPSSSSSPFTPLYASGGTIKGAASPTTPNIDLTRVSRSPYIPVFDIQTPIQQTSLPTTLPTTLNLGSPGAATPSVYYYSTNLSIDAGETININGPVILKINGYLRCNGGTLNINTTGSLVTYFTSYLRVYGSSGGFKNRTKDPSKLVLLGNASTNLANYLILPTTIPTEFYGVIYMPATTATLGLDIRTGNRLFGAISAREITFSSEATLHYDTSLRYATIPGVAQPYAITEWRELTNSTERVTMP